MYLHLGNDVVIRTEDIIAMFDIDACTVSKKTRDFLALAQKRGQVVNVSYELPKSFVVSQEKDKQRIYICQLSPITLIRRASQAEFVCPRCGRESRVYISRSVIFAFLICAILSIALFVLWVYLKLTYNPLGIAAVALPLIIFGLISPRFVNFEPLKKYKKTMEAKRAGIAYSDNLAVSELDNEFSGLDSGSGFRINSDVFNQIKADRSASREQISENELSSTSDKVERPIVHVIDDVSEDHAVDNAPLKKLRSDGSRTRNRHYISSEPVNPAPVTDDEDDDVKEYKPEGSRYSANRRF